jgi:hypothetical protein
VHILCGHCSGRSAFGLGTAGGGGVGGAGVGFGVTSLITGSSIEMKSTDDEETCAGGGVDASNENRLVCSLHLNRCRLITVILRTFWLLFAHPPPPIQKLRTAVVPSAKTITDGNRKGNEEKTSNGYCDDCSCA